MEPNVPEWKYLELEKHEQIGVFFCVQLAVVEQTIQRI